MFLVTNCIQPTIPIHNRTRNPSEKIYQRPAQKISLEAIFGGDPWPGGNSWRRSNEEIREGDSLRRFLKEFSSFLEKIIRGYSQIPLEDINRNL